MERIAVVTGANSGVGREATRRLARAGWRVVMACRSRDRAEEAREGIAADTGSERLEIELADLAELSEVEALAERLLGRLERLDALVANAGLYAPELERTPDGFEMTLAVNHLAHHLLSRRLLPLLEVAGEPFGRVVVVASHAHGGAKLRRAPLEEILRGEAGYGGIQAYADSKLANVLFAFEADRRWRDRGIRVDAVHPGMLATRIWNRTSGLASFLTRLARPLMGDPGKGGDAVARLLLEDDLLEGGGRYFKKKEKARADAAAYDEALARELWEVSERAVGLAG